MAGPLWRVIASDLQEKIETRILQPGAQLPNEVHIRITVTAFPADRNLFMINVGIVPVS
jgi:hypothetical protein